MALIESDSGVYGASSDSGRWPFGRRLGYTRRHQRVSVALTGVARCADGSYVCCLLNICQGGALLHCDAALAPKDRFALIIPLDSGQIEMEAEVCRRDGPDYGVEFVGARPRDRELLFHWIAHTLVSERRQHLPRVQTEGVVVVTGGANQVRGQVTSISPGGVHVQLPRSLRANDVYDVLMFLPGGQASVRAQALRGAGGEWVMRFVSVPVAALGVLKRTIRLCWRTAHASGEVTDACPPAEVSA